MDVPGYAHALTFSCFQQQPFLSRDRARTWTVEAIQKACVQHGFRVWAFVLMPEHVHLLVWTPQHYYSTSAFLSSVKQSVAKRAVTFVRSHAPSFLERMRDRQPNGKVAHRFWQRGRGYDRNIWEPRYIWELIDYIHANPVRRGLCARPEDWIWSSAADYHGLKEGPLVIDKVSLPPRPEVISTLRLVDREHVRMVSHAHEHVGMAPNTRCGGQGHDVIPWPPAI